MYLVFFWTFTLQYLKEHTLDICFICDSKEYLVLNCWPNSFCIFLTSTFKRVHQEKWVNQGCRASQGKKWDTEICCFAWMYLVRFKDLTQGCMCFQTTGNNWTCWEHRRARSDRTEGMLEITYIWIFGINYQILTFPVGATVDFMVSCMYSCVKGEPGLEGEAGPAGPDGTKVNSFSIIMDSD